MRSFASSNTILTAVLSFHFTTQYINAFSATITNPPNVKNSPSVTETLQRQAQADTKARSIHDNHAMNALFVNIEERPKPRPCTISSLSSSSSLPKDLPRGCILRIGPNGGYKEDGFLDGDGMIHCITLPPSSTSNDGNEHDIMYSATYVQTKGRKVERAKRIQSSKEKENNGNTIYKGTLGAAPEGLPMLNGLLQNGLNFRTIDVQKDTCNTAMAVSGSRVLALMEQSPPTEIQFTKDGKMKTIESCTRLDGSIPWAPINSGSFGAHGRTDPTTQERIHVSYNSVAPPFVRVDTFAQGWKLTSSKGVNVPAPIMVHDICITNNYVVIMDFPLTIRPRRFLTNSFPVEYEPNNGARIGLTKRGTNVDDTIWFNVESGVVLHTVNAYEREDGKVVIHGFKAVPQGSSSFILDYTPPFLYEWILDPNKSKNGQLQEAMVEERCLNPDLCVEFPMIENEGVGQRVKATYGLITSSIGGPMLQFKTPETGILLDGVVKMALEDDETNGVVAGGVIDRFDLPKNWHSVSEPTIVTKTDNDNLVGHAGHYVLLIATYVPPDDGTKSHIDVATDGNSMKSQLLILDGDSLSEGPVTTIDLPKHINYGLHSLFLDWEKMK